MAKAAPPAASDHGERLAELIASLQEMGARDSNPVLEILPAGEAPVRGRRYPEGGTLRFGGEAWRAYYHSHPEGPVAPGEHGHFHIFCRRPRDWAHLAALAMDGEGQPLAWCAHNLWVTGGEWLSPEAARECLARPPGGADCGTVERWLGAMLALYAPRLQALLQQRDRALRAGGGGEHLWQDRGVYELARLPVDLVGDLGQGTAPG